MILGVYLYTKSGNPTPNNPAWIIFPLVTCACGLVASIIGLLVVRPSMVRQPMRALNMGFYVAAALNVVLLAVVTQVMLHSWRFFFAGLVGIVLSFAFLFITQYYTAGTWARYRPSRTRRARDPPPPSSRDWRSPLRRRRCRLSRSVIALMSSYYLGQSTGQPHGGIYGTAVATMGMLMTCAYILAMDTFGPITDNAAGIVEMSGAPDAVRDIMDELDSVGQHDQSADQGLRHWLRRSRRLPPF